MTVKVFNEKIKYLRKIIYKKQMIEESKNIILELHSIVHSSKTIGEKTKTLEDELWENISEEKIKNATNNKGRTIAYGIWHSTRIEDITANLLINNSEQIFEKENWQIKINSPIKHTGNSLNKQQIIEFSNALNIEQLKKYRNSVAKQTIKIIKGLKSEDMKRTFQKEQLNKIINQNAVDKDEKALWLIDFWAKKDVAGIILMPLTRHNLVHINESFKAKNKKKY